MTKEQMESDIENLKEKFELLKGQVDTLKIMIEHPPAPKVEEQGVKMVKLIQINVPPVTKTEKVNGQLTTRVLERGKSYFCKTAEEQQIFTANNPGVKTETFNVELQDFVAKKYLEDPENAAQFKRLEAVNA